MIRKNIGSSKTCIVQESKQIGETIEQKVKRIINNKEPITDGAPIIYMDRKEGIKEEYDIRSDRFEMAIQAMDNVQKTKTAKREERLKAREVQGTDTPETAA